MPGTGRAELLVNAGKEGWVSRGERGAGLGANHDPVPAQNLPEPLHSL